MGHKPTFREICQGLRQRAAEELFARARRANVIAKAAFGRGRRLAYLLKQRHLDRAVEVFPEGFVQRPDPRVNRLLVVCTLRNPTRGLHGVLLTGAAPSS